jgi:hypothetical protein
MTMTVEQFIDKTVSQISRGLPDGHPGVEIHIDFKAAPGRADTGSADTVIMAGDASISFSMTVAGQSEVESK